MRPESTHAPTDTRFASRHATKDGGARLATYETPLTRAIIYTLGIDSQCERACHRAT